MDAPAVLSVDDRPPPGRFFLLSIQHVLAMYAGAITVPLAIASAIHLPTDQAAYLISASLLASGIVTLVQCLGLSSIGLRLPVIMGATFVGVTPAIALAQDPSIGLPGVFGGSMVAGAIAFGLVPFLRRLRGVLTSAVTGSAMLLIGLSLIGVAGSWILNGRASGAPIDFLLAGFTFAVIICCIRFGRGVISSGAVFIGLLAGMALALALGQADLSPVVRTPIFRAITPFYFGLPRFIPSAIASMTVVMLITLVESSGMLLLLGVITDQPLDDARLGRGLRADSVGALIGGLCNSFPCTSYSQNIALVSMTGVRSRFVCAGAGVLLIGLAFLPQLSAIVAALPSPVLGGAGLLLFGSVAAAGVRLLADLNFKAGPDAMVVGVSLAFGTLPTAAPTLMSGLPHHLNVFFGNGMLMGVLAAVLASFLLRTKVSA